MANKTAEVKYDKYFITDKVIHDARKPEWGGQVISMSQGHDDVIPAIARALPAITVVRKPYMFHDVTHKHLFTEYFFFWGSNPNNMKEFDDEVEYSFGPEREKQVIKKPTIVVAAPGVYHCPLNYARVNKPFYCMELFMTTEYSGINLGEDLKEIRVPEQDYKRYFTNMGVVNTNKWGGEGMSLAAVPKDIIPAGASISAGVSVVRSPYMFHDKTHKHNFTEYFYFFGANPNDMNEFDAEVEFTIGEEKEKHLIKQPTIVVVPPGVYHCPLNYAKVGKPIYCVEIFISHKYTSQDLDRPMPGMPAPRG